MKRYSGVLMTAAVAAFVSFATMILVLPFGGQASQNNQYLPTTGTYNGLAAANTVNSAIDSLNTCNAGSVAPVNALGGVPKEGMCWLDTTSSTAKVLKRYTGAAWVVEGVLDVTNGRWQPPIGGGTASVASAGTTDLCASPQALQTVSGTTTITSFGSNCIVGIRKTLIFSGALTLTHNATSLIIPGSLSKTTAAGDVAEAVYLGSGNWRLVSFVPLAGTVVASIDGATGLFTTAAANLKSTGNVLDLSTARQTLPTRQIFTSGSGTYTKPSNVLYIKVRACGGGGGGGGSGVGGTGGTGNAGGNTTFSTFTAGGGSAGTGSASSAANGGAGGTASGGSINLSGDAGSNAVVNSGGTNRGQDGGGSSFFGGSGKGGTSSGGGNGGTNTGGGGGGGYAVGTSTMGGSGGGGGGCIEGWINSPSSTYPYAVGGGGTGGTAGTSGNAGGTAGSGIAIVEEFYN